MKISVKYNAPLTLTYSLAATAILLTEAVFRVGLIETFFLVPGRGGFNPGNPVHYLTLITYVLGHASLPHLMGNLAFILLLGPILEEKYGTGKLFLMVLITALATGILNILVFPSALLGGSGIVFMMIILSSFTNIRNGELPLTFILILLIYLTTEITNAFSHDDISQFAHITGGVLGSIFGYFRGGR